MEETGCEIICGAPVTLVGKGQVRCCGGGLRQWKGGEKILCANWSKSKACEQKKTESLILSVIFSTDGGGNSKYKYQETNDKVALSDITTANADLP